LVPATRRSVITPAAVIAALAAIALSPGRAEGLPEQVAMPVPGWARSAVIYGAVVERFGERGDFAALRRRLAYLDHLGIDAIWLSPVNATLPDDFGYAVTGYRRLRPDYGTKAEFRRLIAAAHRRGMRVLMDLVPNHTSRQHRWFQTARRQGPGSPLWRFYERDRDGRPKHYFDWRNLPNLDYDNPEVRRRILAISSYWVRRFGIDGYRVDAAWGVRRRRPSFWPRWSRRIKSIDPDALLLAEASARHGWYARHGFDATYDWGERLGEPAWSELFDQTARIGPRIDRALRRTPHGAAGSLVLRFLEDNDTGERFFDRHGGGLTRTAAALLLTVPGMPLLYTGQEVGASFDPYSLAAPVDWRDRHHLRRRYRRLIALRHRLPALSGSHLKPVWGSPPSAYAYVRPGSEGTDPVLVALNFSDRRRTLRLSPRPALAPFISDGSRDLLGGRDLPPLGSAPRLAMPPHGSRVIVPGAP
jgi:cyclomaltodextrinase